MTTKLTKSRLRQIIQEELRFKYCESCWVEKDSDEKFEKCPHCKEEMCTDCFLDHGCESQNFSYQKGDNE